MSEHARHLSPLRYPGGKARLAPYVAAIFDVNGLCDGHYAEPYAGGAGVALSLLVSERASIIHLNDIDRGGYAFWHSVLHATEQLCRLIETASLSVDGWQARRTEYFECERDDLLTLGFATFFLNRTNRSGIVRGGIIGGLDQQAEWGIDARFNREDLVRRVERCATFGDRIRLTNMDAIEFLGTLATSLPERSLTYCDPPYLVKGTRRLYTNWYEPNDHADVADTLAAYPLPWLVTYDAVPEIRALYEWAPSLEYDLSYSASERYRGTEAIFHAPELRLPATANPATFGRRLRAPA